MRGWKKVFHANGNQKKAGGAIFTSDKIDFKIKTVSTRDKEGYYITIKGSIQEEYITIYNNCKYVNICTQHRSTKYIWQILTAMKGEIYSNTVIVGDYNTPLTAMDKSSRQKINKETGFK